MPWEKRSCDAGTPGACPAPARPGLPIPAPALPRPAPACPPRRRRRCPPWVMEWVVLVRPTRLLSLLLFMLGCFAFSRVGLGPVFILVRGACLQYCAVLAVRGVRTGSCTLFCGCGVHTALVPALELIFACSWRVEGCTCVMFILYYFGYWDSSSALADPMASPGTAW